MRFHFFQSLCLVLSLCTLTLAISSKTRPTSDTVEPQYGDVGSLEEDRDLHYLRPTMKPTHQDAQSIASPRLIRSQAPHITAAPARDVAPRKPIAPAFGGKTVTVTKYREKTVTYTKNETKTLTVTLPKTIYQRITRTKSIIVSDGVAVSTKYNPAMGDTIISYGKGMRRFSVVAGIAVWVVMFLFF